MIGIDDKAGERLAKPDHILVATDLNDLDVLLPAAVCQAKLYNAQLTFVHSLVIGGNSFMEGGAGREDRAAHQQMVALSSKVEAEGLRCNTEIAYTYSPEHALSQAARQIQRGRLIMATHGRGRLGQIMLGSVARELLTFLDIPIFAVGPNAGPQASYCNPKKILHPISFSNGQEKRSLEFALKLAEVHGAELVLMHVHGPGKAGKIDSERIRQLMEEARAGSSTPTHTRVAYGNVAEEILNTARLYGADWLVLGTKPIAAAPMSYAPFTATSMAYRLMAAAHIPVLTFPHRIYSITPNLTRDNLEAASMGV